MASKIACTVLLVLFVSIAKAQSLGDPLQVGDIDSLVEEFRNEGARVVKHAFNKTKHAEILLFEWSLYEVNKTEDLMRLLDGGWRHELRVIEEKAKEANVSIDECVGRRETVLDDIPRNFSKALRSHRNETLHEGVLKGKLFLIELNRTIDHRSGEFKREIVGCANSTNSTRCLQELTFRVEFEIKNLPREVEYETVINNAKIIDLLLRIQEFSVEELRKWESIGHFIIREIVHCAEKKIHE